MQGWRPAEQDHWIAQEAVNAMKATRPTVTFVNFPEIGILRRSVPAARAAGVEKTILRGLDADIGSLLRESRREGTYKSTTVVVTSGRAFEPIRTRMSYSHLSNAVIAAGGQKTYLAGDGSALLGLRDPLQAQPVAQALQAENAGSIDAVYFKSQSGNNWSYSAQFIAPQVNADFARAGSSLLSTAASAAAPDVVVAYRPYAGLVPPRQPGGLTGALGLQWPVQHVPLIIAGHGVYAGRTSTYPARLVDIAPTLEAELGLPVGSHDGIVLHDALFGATAGTDTQVAARKKLSPLSAALQQRAAGVAP
jgi:arylsulfatase A-like enzyme